MKKSVIALLSVIFAQFVIACNDYSIVQTTVLGTAVADPSTASNGDEVELSIGGGITSSGTVSINGKEYCPVIHYLIDGKEVAKSSDKDIPFKATYILKDLPIGEHELSVEITSSHKGGQYDNAVKSSTITITE